MTQMIYVIFLLCYITHIAPYEIDVVYYSIFL